jgi:hypothetical protein
MSGISQTGVSPIRKRMLNQRNEPINEKNKATVSNNTDILSFRPIFKSSLNWQSLDASTIV